MKTAWMVYRWIIISVVAQVFILLFINYVYLGGSREAIIIPSGGIDDKIKGVDTKLKIPSEATLIEVSQNGLYAAYFFKDKLEIIDIKKNTHKRTVNIGEDKLSFYRWLPDRNMIIYALSSPTSKTPHVQIITMDIESGEERKITDIVKDIKINSEVIDVELSTLTNIVYAFIKIDENQGKVYKFNIMDKITSIIPLSPNSVIKETNYSDKLLYQDSKNKLFVRDGIKNVTWPFPYKNKMALLDVDSTDRVYVGELNKDNNVSKIYYGKLTVEPDKAWTPVSLKKPVLPSAIFITPQGTMYEIVESESAVYNIATNSKISYSGKLIEILDDYIVTNNEGELKLTVVNN